MLTNPPPPAKQLEEILKRYEKIKGNGRSNLEYHAEEDKTEVITSMIAAIERLAPKHTYYYQSLKLTLGNRGNIIPKLLGTVRSLKTAYESGYLHEIEELIHADLFSDFLDMGDYLLKDGFKDPAAVIIGGVLEEHLRKLCIKSSIDINIADRPKKAERMNQELAKAGTYNILDQKNITAWLDLRNKAAHGKFNEYTFEHVQLMLSGVRIFISSIPA